MTQYNGVTIPPAQDLPPAGFDTIAFRPLCSQLNSVGYSDGLTHWNLHMPDSNVITLKKLSTSLPRDQAHETLNSAGLCKLGTAEDGLIDVPIVYTHQIPKRAVPQLTANVVDHQTLPNNSFTRFPIESVFGGVLLLAGLGLVIHSLIGHKSQPTPSTSATDDVLKDLFSNAS